MGIFETMLGQFNAAMSNWETVAIGIASRLFYLLAVIQLAWAGILWMLTHESDPLYHLTELVKKVLVLAFFWTVIENATEWIPAIVNSFRWAGQEMTGIEKFSPSEVLYMGANIVTTLFNASQSGGIFEKIVGAVLGGIVGMLIFLAFLAVAIEATLVFLGLKVILFWGLISLGFAGSQWTQDFTQKYFVTCIHIGFKLLFLTLIIGLAANVTKDWPEMARQGIANDKLFETYFAMLAVSVLYAVMVIRIPDMAASMLTGSFGMGFGSQNLVVGGLLLGGGALKLMKGVPAGIAGAGSALYQAGKAGFTTNVGMIPALLRGTAMQMKTSSSEAISKTTGGKIANYIKTINAANSKIKSKVSSQITGN